MTIFLSHVNYQRVSSGKIIKDRVTPHVNFFQKYTEEKVKFNRKRRDGDQDQVGKCVCICMCMCVSCVQVSCCVSELCVSEL